MPIQAQDIVDRAEWYLKIDILENEGIALVNEALDRLGNAGLAYDEVTVDAVEERTFYDLPDNVTGVIYAVNENDNLFYRWQYNLDNQIRFAKTGEYRLSLRIVPEPVVALEGEDGEIDLNVLYRASLVECVRGLSKLKDDDHSPDGARLMQEFERLAVRAFNALLENRKPSQVRVLRHA